MMIILSSIVAGLQVANCGFFLATVFYIMIIMICFDDHHDDQHGGGDDNDDLSDYKGVDNYHQEKSKEEIY